MFGEWTFLLEGEQGSEINKAPSDGKENERNKTLSDRVGERN